MLSKAADAAVWEELKDIRPHMYDGNPLNLDHFLEKLDDCGMTVTEDMDPAVAKEYVFKQLRWCLLEVLQALYFVAAREGKIKTFEEAKKRVKEEQRVDAPQVAAKRRRAINLQHDGKKIRWGIGGTSGDSTSCSAGACRTATRVMSGRACSISSRRPG